MSSSSEAEYMSRISSDTPRLLALSCHSTRVATAPGFVPSISNAARLRPGTMPFSILLVMPAMVDVSAVRFPPARERLSTRLLSTGSVFRRLRGIRAASSNDEIHPQARQFRRQRLKPVVSTLQGKSPLNGDALAFDVA